MPARRPSRPWRLVRRTPGVPVSTQYRSLPALYRAVQDERERIAAGMSRVTAMTAYQWDTGTGRWVRYESLPISEPTTEETD
jgi:hypothetical protein